MRLQAAIDQFMQYSALEKKQSKHSCSAYASDLLQFSDYLATTYQITLITDFNHLQIRSWIASLMRGIAKILSKIRLNLHLHWWLQRCQILKICA
jgi:site-specific recombinase XerD